MNNKSKKYQINKKLNVVQEPILEYKSEINISHEVINDDWNDLPDFVKKSIQIGIEDSKKGLGDTQEEFMKIVKEKYPFVNGI